MLRIFIKGQESFDEKTNEFITIKDQELTLEHSLVSISKWEAKWHKPFLGKEEKTTEQIIDYVKCMSTTQNVDSIVFNFLTNDHIKEINDYIENPMTATWFSNINQPVKHSTEQITSELIYYWMIALNIPFECQKWHLNRLLTLIRVCNVKNNSGKKASKKDILSKNAAINAARRKELGTSG